MLQVPASASPWRAKRGKTFAFFNIIVAKDQKIEGGHFGEIFYAEKQEKPFWCSSLEKESL